MGSSHKHRLYIGGDAYTAPAVYMNTGNGWSLYYICRDYLGTMTHLVASNGTVVQELSYDAWGRQRNPETHAVYLPDNETELLLGRGYTGHEHLPMFGLTLTRLREMVVNTIPKSLKIGITEHLA